MQTPRLRTRPSPPAPPVPQERIRPTNPKEAGRRAQLEKEQDYEVGYGKPPVATRFKPGQSGNPKGRPKGARSLSTILAEELRSTITISENGKKATVTKMRAIMKRVVADSMAGKHGMLKVLLSLAPQHGDEAEDAKLSSSDEELLRQLMRGL